MAIEIDYIYLSKLVGRTQMGDSDAFAELYASTYKTQYQYAYKYLQDEFLAQDALEKTYVIVHDYISKLRDPRDFLKWLEQINFRVCFRISQQYMQFEERVQDYEKGRDLIKHGGSPDMSREEIRQMENDFILEQIMRLPLQESMVLVLKYCNGLKLDEIAAFLNTSKKTVRRSLRDGRYKLKHALRTA